MYLWSFLRVLSLFHHAWCWLRDFLFEIELNCKSRGEGEGVGGGRGCGGHY